MQTSAVRDDHSWRLESAARAAMELRADRNFTDAEWAAVRSRLVEFMRILRGWEQTTTVPRRANLEVLCQPEP